MEHQYDETVDYPGFYEYAYYAESGYSDGAGTEYLTYLGDAFDSGSGAGSDYGEYYASELDGTQSYGSQNVARSSMLTGAQTADRRFWDESALGEPSTQPAGDSAGLETGSQNRARVSGYGTWPVQRRGATQDVQAAVPASAESSGAAAPTDAQAGEQAAGGGDGGGGGLVDWLQGGLDALGVVDPTPICDGINGAISWFRGNKFDAACSWAGMLPYLGDLGKVAKYGNKVRKAIKAADAVADTARALDKANDARRSFNSFRGLKRAMGTPGEGNVWHHIVEQRNVARFGAEAIHNTDNVVAVPREVNQAIANYYSSKRKFTGGKTVREWLQDQSFEEQMEFGRRILERVLEDKPLP